MKEVIKYVELKNLPGEECTAAGGGGGGLKKVKEKIYTKIKKSRVSENGERLK